MLQRSQVLLCKVWGEPCLHPSRGQAITFSAHPWLSSTGASDGALEAKPILHSFIHSFTDSRNSWEVSTRCLAPCYELHLPEQKTKSWPFTSNCSLYTDPATNFPGHTSCRGSPSLSSCPLLPVCLLWYSVGGAFVSLICDAQLESCAFQSKAGCVCIKHLLVLTMTMNCVYVLCTHGPSPSPSQPPDLGSIGSTNKSPGPPSGRTAEPRCLQSRLAPPWPLHQRWSHHQTARVHLNRTQTPLFPFLLWLNRRERMSGTSFPRCEAFQKWTEVPSTPRSSLLSGSVTCRCSGLPYTSLSLPLSSPLSSPE